MDVFHLAMLVHIITPDITGLLMRSTVLIKCNLLFVSTTHSDPLTLCSLALRKLVAVHRDWLTQDETSHHGSDRCTPFVDHIRYWVSGYTPQSLNDKTCMAELAWHGMTSHDSATEGFELKPACQGSTFVFVLNLNQSGTNKWWIITYCSFQRNRARATKTVLVCSNARQLCAWNIDQHLPSYQNFNKRKALRSGELRNW